MYSGFSAEKKCSTPEAKYSFKDVTEYGEINKFAVNIDNLS